EVNVIQPMIAGDRDWLRTLAPAELAARMADELRFLGLAHGERAVPIRELLEANAPHMAAFLQGLPREKRQSDWVWAVPDPRAFATLPPEVREGQWSLIVEQLRSPVDPEAQRQAGEPALAAT